MTYPPALFAYAVTPTVVPCTTGDGHDQPVTLMVTVNNPTGKHVDCPQLVFSLPIGEGAGDLTNNPSALSATPARGVPWSIASDKAGNLTAVPEGTNGLGAGDSIAFLISGIEVNSLPGLAMISVWEETDELRYSNLGVSKVAPGLAITSFTANPVQVPAGSSTTLSWTTTGAQTCTLSWQGNTKPGLPVNGTLQVSPQETTTYTLTATSTPNVVLGSPDTHAQVGTVADAQVTVYVPQVQVLSLSAAPAQILMGEKTTLSWEVVNADSCVINPGHHIVDPTVGSLVLEPAESTQYSLAATGLGRTVEMLVSVSVRPPTIAYFTANPSEIVPGGTSTLSWATEGSTAPWVIDPIGTVPAKGSVQVKPTSQTTLTLHPQPTEQPHAVAQLVVCPGFVMLRGRQTEPLFFTVDYSSVGAPSVHADFPDGGGDFGPSDTVSRVAWRITLRINDERARSRVHLSMPPPDVSRGTVNSICVRCDNGLNSVGATATVTWDIVAPAPQGEIVVKNGSHSSTTQLVGGTGEQTFVIGDEWSVAFFADAKRSPASASLSCIPESTIESPPGPWGTES